jgi:histidine triad (HIT) family protein
MAKEGCVFCGIVAGDIPAVIVLDEPGALAFLDARPVFPGHVLVVPREHYETILDIPDGELAPVMAAAKRVAGAIVAGLQADGTFVAMNNVVSQSVPHLHVHVVPRRRKDGLRGFFWPRQKYASDAEMAETAAAIRAHL